jgi:hypothetical protein
MPYNAFAKQYEGHQRQSMLIVWNIVPQTNGTSRHGGLSSATLTIVFIYSPAGYGTENLG